MIHFQGAIDSYDPDGMDPGFVEHRGVPAKYGDGSVISPDDTVMQQSIFDRLPLSSQSKAEFYNWLLTDYAAEQQVTVPGSLQPSVQRPEQEQRQKKRKIG